jgi:hypothetical protein
MSLLYYLSSPEQDRRLKEILNIDVIQLFQVKKDCNIAVLTGKVSTKFAFDIDGENAEKCFEEAVKSLDDQEIKDAIKNTMQTRTGSGCDKHVILGLNPT